MAEIMTPLLLFNALLRRCCDDRDDFGMEPSSFRDEISPSLRDDSSRDFERDGVLLLFEVVRDILSKEDDDNVNPAGWSIRLGTVTVINLGNWSRSDDD